MRRFSFQYPMKCQVELVSFFNAFRCEMPRYLRQSEWTISKTVATGFMSRARIKLEQTDDIATKIIAVK